jgi:NAD(P)-dependent dehydrogenase (short-subunit alcohol dehydrogenase family)
MGGSENHSTGRLQGKRAIVTGAASGMGLATVSRFLAEGARVVLIDARADALAEASQQFAGQAMAITCDVADESAVAAAIAGTVAELGGIDVVAHCAGIVRTFRTHEISLADWDSIIRVNLTGAFLVIKHAIPHLLAAGGGSIVTIGSVGSVVAAGRCSGYDAAKGGVLQLTRAVAVEYCEEGIRANCVLPGYVKTSLVASSIALHGPMSTDTRQAPASRLRVPMERAADPSEIASVVAFLASDDASFITGAAIAADGGYTAI